MADLNEPKKETERIGFPPPVGAKPPVHSFRPPAPPSTSPTPLHSKEELTAGPRPPTPPTMHPSAPATARPPNDPPSPANAPGSSKPGLPPTNRPLENRDLLGAGPRQETVAVAASPLKGAMKPGNVPRASVPLTPVIRAPSPVVANSPAKGLDALAPVHLCWTLLGISVLSLLSQLWYYFS